MKRALITKEQETALKHAKNFDHYLIDNIIPIILDGGFQTETNKHLISLNNLSIQELVLAWNEYYEIKKTPQELVTEKYNIMLEHIKNKEVQYDDLYESGFLKGIVFVNDTLNLELDLK